MEADILSQLIAARLDEGTREPAAHAIVQGVWLGVVEGSVDTGERLPTARHLAVQLGVSPRTVERAYAELQSLGVVATRTGEGTFVALDPPRPDGAVRHRELAVLCRETLARAETLGFGLDELLEAMAALRLADRPRSPEAAP